MLTLTLFGLAEAATWTVDPAGGGDATTIAEGVALLSEGDTLQIAAGTYQVLGLRVDVDNVTLEGAGPESTIFEGSGMSAETDSAGVIVTGGGVEIRSVAMRGYVGGEGWSMALVPGDATRVIDCLFQDNFMGVVMDYTISAEGMSVIDSAFVRNEYGIYLYESFTALRVEGSLFADNSTGIDYTTDTHNMLHFDQLSIINNTFVGDDGYSIRVGGGFSSYTGGGDFKVELVNNLFSGTAMRWRFPSGTWEGEDITIRNNLYSATTTAWVQDDTEVTYTDNQEAEAIFVSYSDDGDWTNDDLRLAEGSPGIDDGVSGYATSEVDAYGTPRSEDGDGDGVGAPDVGAYERCPTDDCSGADTSDTGGSGGSGGEESAAADTSPRPADRSLFSCASGGAPAGGLLAFGALALGLTARRRGRV